MVNCPTTRETTRGSMLICEWELESTRPVATNTHKISIGMIAAGFALRDERLGLLTAETLLDEFENLLLGHAGIFEATDLRAGECRQALHAPAQNGLHGFV